MVIFESKVKLIHTCASNLSIADNANSSFMLDNKCSYLVL